jgi:hypothetical protein
VIKKKKRNSFLLGVTLHVPVQCSFLRIASCPFWSSESSKGRFELITQLNISRDQYMDRRESRGWLGNVASVELLQKVRKMGLRFR